MDDCISCHKSVSLKNKSYIPVRIVTKICLLNLKNSKLHRYKYLQYLFLGDYSVTKLTK